MVNHKVINRLLVFLLSISYTYKLIFYDEETYFLHVSGNIILADSCTKTREFL